MTTQPSLFDDPPSSGGEPPETLALAEFAERAYLDYAISVVKGRALPDVSDGQKPVQRRILYAMNELGLSSEAKPRKSAAVVGDVLGKFHPHGDQSVYDALVRMAQDFTMRYPLIDGHGNFGSRDGDGAAAMRYTEARLTPMAQLLLDEIGMGTAEFQANYDGSSSEPVSLPARLPVILLNGASGIAVGMATEIPPHNLTETANAAAALIRNPDLTHSELMDILPGPDFPGGGQIITAKSAISSIYETGRGTIRVRARWKIEEFARGQWQAVVTELPPGTSAQKVLEEIEELTNPKVRPGKKSLSAEQASLRQQFLGILDGVRDEASREAPVRIVLEPKSRRQNPDEFMQAFLAHTSLECNTPVNLVMIGLDGRPRQKGLAEILKEWIRFRFDTVEKRTAWRLGQVNDRIHILEGRETVLLNIDEVIRIIRESDAPKEALISAFSLSERQADDILEIRLRQLARMEKIRIEQELKELREEKKSLEDLLQNPESMKRLIIREIGEVRRKFGDARRTLIEETERAAAEQKIPDEAVTVIVSKNGWLRQRSGHGLDLSGVTFKSGDTLFKVFECRSTDLLLAFSDTGRVYTIPAHQLPGGRGDGMPVTGFAEIPAGETIVQYFAGPPSAQVLIASDAAYSFSAKVSDMATRTKNGKSFVALEKGQSLLPPQAIADDAKRIAALTSGGKILVSAITELRALASGGHGVLLVSPDEGEKLLSAIAVTDQGFNIIYRAKNGNIRKTPVAGSAVEQYTGRRGRKGKKLESRSDAVGLEPIKEAEKEA